MTTMTTNQTILTSSSSCLLTSSPLPFSFSSGLSCPSFPNVALDEASWKELRRSRHQHIGPAKKNITQFWSMMPRENPTEVSDMMFFVNYSSIQDSEVESESLLPSSSSLSELDEEEAARFFPLAFAFLPLRFLLVLVLFPLLSSLSICSKRELVIVSVVSSSASTSHTRYC